MSDRTILVGDLHGCHDEAVTLLKKCNVDARDRVIFLGDLVDRGPDVGKCVDLVMQREQVQGSRACILGNHEEKHLFYQDIERTKGRVNIHIGSHITTRSQLRPEHYDYFQELPLYLRLPEHNAVAVHAGVFPGRTIEQQTHRHLMHIQMINPFDPSNPDPEKSMWVSKVPKDQPNWRFWTHLWDGPERIIFGHSVLNKPLITDKAVGIDGGCCFGLELWAFILPDNELVRVSSTGPHGSRGRDVHLVHGDVGTF